MRAYAVALAAGRSIYAIQYCYNILRFTSFCDFLFHIQEKIKSLFQAFADTTRGNFDLCLYVYLPYWPIQKYGAGLGDLGFHFFGGLRNILSW